MTDEMKNLILQYVDSVQKIYGTHLKTGYFIWLVCPGGDIQMWTFMDPG